MTNFPEQLVRRVAESDPWALWEDGETYCYYCDNGKGAGHDPDCMYTRSVEWVKRWDDVSLKVTLITDLDGNTYDVQSYKDDEQNTGDEDE